MDWLFKPKKPPDAAKEVTFQTMKDLTGYLPPDKIAELLDVCTKPRDKLLLTIYAETGLRLNEPLGLKPRDIMYDLRKIKVPILKQRGEVKNLISVSDATLAMLKGYTEAEGIQQDQCIFESSWRPGKPISDRRVRQILTQTGRLIGIEYVGEKKLHPHHLRHSVGVATYRRTKDLELTRKKLNHKRISSTAIYVQFAPTEETQEQMRYWEHKKETNDV